MIHYFAPSGVSITREHWCHLYRRREHHYDTRAGGKGWTVETSWLGIALSHEQRPPLWLLRVWGPAVPQGPRYLWFHSREEALAAQQFWEVELAWQEHTGEGGEACAS